MTFALGLLLWLTVSATFAFGISRLPRVTVEPERNEAPADREVGGGASERLAA